MHDENETLKTTREIAAHYRISEKTLLRWVHQRRCPVIQLPGELRYRLDDVAAWLANKNWRVGRPRKQVAEGGAQ